MPASHPPLKRRVVRTAQQEELAFQRLRQAVLTGAFKEGETVREARLAREWEIGRTPLRQAVRRAAEFGYFTLRPNQAPVVRRLSAEDIENIYTIREELECLALQGAWKALTPSHLQGIRDQIEKIEATAPSPPRLRRQFVLDENLHGLWIGLCRNPWLAEALDRLFIYRPNQLEILKNHPNLAESAFADHREIVDSLEHGSLAEATRLLRRHIRRSGAGLVQFLRGLNP